METSCLTRKDLGMLRTLFAIIVLSFFVTPVFATSNKVLPKMYSEEEYEEIQDLYEYGPNVTISSDQNGSPTKLIVSGWGTSTSSALCSVLEGLLREGRDIEHGDFELVENPHWG